MNLAEIKQFVQENGGRAAPTSLINLAARELWYGSTQPDITETCFIQATDTSRIALPWFVHNIIAANYAEGIPIELNTPLPQFNPGDFMRVPFQWRIIGYSPLQTDIRAGGKLTFRKTNPKHTGKLRITITGQNEFATRVVEPLDCVSQDTVTNEVYHQLQAIERSETGGCDIQVLDVTGLEVAFLPVHLLTARRQLIEISNCCNTTGCKTFKIAYKPVLPPLVHDSDTFPAEIFSDAVAWMALSIDAMHAKPENAGVYASKAAGLYGAFVNEQLNGRRLKVRTTRDTYTFPCRL